MENKPKRIIWHHSADTTKTPQASKIDAYHKSKNFPVSALGYYGGYHVLIERDGSRFRYRGDTETGAHDKDENIDTLGVCLAGNFDIELPTENQKMSLARLLEEWTIIWSIPKENIEPHRLHDTTSCPGTKLYNDWAKEILNDLPTAGIKNTIIKILEKAIQDIHAAR